MFEVYQKITATTENMNNQFYKKKYTKYDSNLQKNTTI